MSLANGQKLKVAAEGTVFIPDLGQKLESVLYVPQLDCNILSVFALDKQGYVITFENGEYKIKKEIMFVQGQNKKIICMC